LPRVAILIPASPTHSFFSQIAAFSGAIRSLPWTRWVPTIHVVMGGSPDMEAFLAWRPYLRDVVFSFVEEASFSKDGIWAQLDSLYNWAPATADVVVRMDADTFPVASLEHILDSTSALGAISGVMAHTAFPSFFGQSSRDAWRSVARGLVGRELAFTERYSLADQSSTELADLAPFYINDGFVAISQSILSEIVRAYLRFRPKLIGKFPYPYFAGQVSLALAVAEIAAPYQALPLRYNFPNDPRAAERYPEELDNAIIFHYLRTDEIARGSIFSSRAGYKSFADRSLNGVNNRLREHILNIFGRDYPFARVERDPSRPNIVAPTTCSEELPGASAPLSHDVRQKLLAFQKSEGRDLFALQQFKRALVAAFGVEKGFRRYQEALRSSQSDGCLRIRHIESLHGYAKTLSDCYFEIGPEGECFTAELQHVIGDGNHRQLIGNLRALFMTCLSEARMLGRSALIQVGEGNTLLDYQEPELTRINDRIDWDPGVFRSISDAGWLIEAQDSSDLKHIAAAFSLVGAHSFAFGHWMVEYLPKYVMARMSGMLPRVPVLIDAGMPKSHREALEFLYPDIEIVEIVASQRAQVKELWCVSTLSYMPVFEEYDDKFRWDYVALPAIRFIPVIEELRTRAERQLGVAGEAGRVFLARRNFRHRRLVNHTEIELIAVAYGCTVLYPEDLSFREQVEVVRNSKVIIAPAGAAMYLAMFALPGTELILLSHPYTIWLAADAVCPLQNAGLNVKVLTGRYVEENAQIPFFADYWIDCIRFRALLDGQLEQ
jgi:hypothetical protein